MEHTDRGPILIGVVAALLFAALVMFKGRVTDEVPPPALQPAVAEPVLDLQQDRPRANRPVREQANTQVIYECMSKGQRVFGDSPCGADAKTRDISPINGMDTHQPIYRSDAASVPDVTLRDTSVSYEAPTRDCTEFESAVKQIDARMRLGYTSSEGEYWHERHRNAMAAREDCKRHNRLR